MPVQASAPANHLQCWGSGVGFEQKDPTYLLADVEIVQTFKLANINRRKLEILLHKFFFDARLDVELKDRFGQGIEPKEWFLVPVSVIQDAVGKLMNGSIGDFRYDPKLAKIVRYDV